MCLLDCIILINICALASFGGNVGATTEDSPVIQTSYGPVQGLKFISNWTNQPVYAFRGIPYAAPPLGILRFQDPVSPEKWTTTKNCTIDGSYCPQTPTYNPPKSGNVTEDCLFINVYTPRIEPEANQPLLPVMVWIHGGAYLEGSGDYSYYGPDFLLAEGVVVVTLNYRLGVFGFLNLGIPEVAGNAGLKDQAFALKWVQNEISNFGGNAANVTLFGESVGSLSIHLHYLSPFSKGLFHRVIGESGAPSLGTLKSYEFRTKMSDNPLSSAMALMNITNCTSTDLQISLKCLRGMDVKTLFKAQFLDTLKISCGRVTPDQETIAYVRFKQRMITGGEYKIMFKTSIDSSSPQPFLPDLTRNLAKKNKGSFVPFLMGINSDEGLMVTPGMKEEDISKIAINIENLISENVKNASNKSHVELQVHKVMDFYFKGQKPSLSNLKGYIDFLTDVIFGYSTSVTAKAYRGRAPLFLYMFSYNGKFKELEHPKFNLSGVSHGDELGYLFVQEKKNQTVPEDSSEMITWRRMVRMWTNFAKFGSPTPEADPLLQNVIWLPVDNKSTRHLNIGANLTMEETDFLHSQVQLWDSVLSSNVP